MLVGAEDGQGVVLLEKLCDLLETAEGEADEEDSEYLCFLGEAQHYLSIFTTRQ